MAEGERQRADQAFHELPVGADMGSIEYTLSQERVERHLRVKPIREASFRRDSAIGTARTSPPRSPGREGSASWPR